MVQENSLEEYEGIILPADTAVLLSTAYYAVAGTIMWVSWCWCWSDMCCNTRRHVARSTPPAEQGLASQPRPNPHLRLGKIYVALVAFFWGMVSLTTYEFCLESQDRLSQDYHGRMRITGVTYDNLSREEDENTSKNVYYYEAEYDLDWGYSWGCPEHNNKECRSRVRDCKTKICVTSKPECSRDLRLAALEIVRNCANHHYNPQGNYTRYDSLLGPSQDLDWPSVTAFGKCSRCDVEWPSEVATLEELESDDKLAIQMNCIVLVLLGLLLWVARIPKCWAAPPVVPLPPVYSLIANQHETSHPTSTPHGLPRPSDPHTTHVCGGFIYRLCCPICAVLSVQGCACPELFFAFFGGMFYTVFWWDPDPHQIQFPGERGAADDEEAQLARNSPMPSRGIYGFDVNYHSSQAMVQTTYPMPNQHALQCRPLPSFSTSSMAILPQNDPPENHIEMTVFSRNSTPV